MLEAMNKAGFPALFPANRHYNLHRYPVRAWTFYRKLGGIQGEMMRMCCLMLVVLLAGCNTLEGIGKDLQRGGEMIEKAATK